PAAEPQKTPQKRGQKQERQGSHRGGDVYAAAWRRRQTPRPTQQEVVRKFCGQSGGGGMGSRRGDQAWLRAGHDQDRAGAVRRLATAGEGHGASVSQGHLHRGRVACGRETLGGGTPLSQGGKRRTGSLGRGSENAAL